MGHRGNGECPTSVLLLPSCSTPRSSVAELKPTPLFVFFMLSRAVGSEVERTVNHGHVSFLHMLDSSTSLKAVNVCVGDSTHHR